MQTSDHQKCKYRFQRVLVESVTSKTAKVRTRKICITVDAYYIGATSTSLLM